jgi:hypothetical protein
VGGFTPPVGSGLGGGTKLPEVGGVLVGVGVVGGGGGGGATKLPEVGGIAASPPGPAAPRVSTVPPVPAALPATRTPPSSVLAGAPALLGGGATKLPEVAGSRTQAAT